MKRSRFTEEQIIAVVREHEAVAKTADLARKTVVQRPGVPMEFVYLPEN